MQSNVVLVVTDQLTPLLMGTYGHEVVKTPNLDRLAKRGVRFDAAYTPCPVCSPARAALMTGRDVSRIGAWDNAALFPADQPTFAHYLTNAGYECVLTGKMHFVGPDQLHGFERRLTTDIYPSDFSWTRTRDWEGKPMWMPNGMTPGYVAEGVGPRRWTQFLEYDEATHYRALEFIRRHHARETQAGRAGSEHDSSTRAPGTAERERRPFMLTVSYHHPHEPFNPPQEYWDLYEDTEIPVPEIPEEIDTLRTTMDRWLHGFHGLDTKDVTDPQSLRALQRAYYALVTYVDHLVGELVDELERQGLAESTVIVFTSDHGDMLGARGMIQKRTFYEQSVRVPLIAAFPDRRGAGTVVDEPVSLIDLLPTFAEIAGVPLDLLADHDGESLVSLCGGARSETRSSAPRTAYSEYHSEGVYAPCFMVRRGRYKYVLIHGHERQLYDLEHDPGEWTNLAGSEEHRATEAELETALLERFDPATIETAVRASIARRMVIDPAMKANRTRWDYTACEDGRDIYIRPHEPAPEARPLPWTETERKAR